MPGKYFKKAVARKAKRTIRAILRATAPYWGPPVLIFCLAYSAYMILFEIPKEAIADTATSQLTKVEAFLGITEDSNAASTADTNLLDEYKAVANTWDKGLTPEQKNQVQTYKFPYSVLMAVDRVVNDQAVWDGKQNVAPQPQKVFGALKPKFTWKDSTITTVTVTVTTDAKGNKISSTSTNEQHISLVASADTFEGHFAYTYEWISTTSPGPDGGSVTVTREVVKQITPPALYYLPLNKYLQSARGITDKDTFELIANLAMSYDPEYAFNLGIQGGQNYETYPAYALAYADAVQRVLTQYSNIPQSLFLALIAHESRGNWQTVNMNTNGTEDAGLCQINTVNWVNYGLTQNPFNVAQNIEAGASLLGKALDQYNDITKALYAYNGGTPSNGETYNPTYAPAVLAIFTQLQSTPAFAIYVPPMSGEPWTILAAEQDGTIWQAYGQSGENFSNPQEITVMDERTGETQKVERAVGDGTMWAGLAWVYRPSFRSIQKGDILKVQFDDGKSVEVKATN